MKTTIVGTLMFGLLRAGPSLLLSLSLFFTGPTRPDATGDFLLVAYYLAMSDGPATLGFLLVTGLSPTWRRLSVGRGVIIAGVIGLFSPIVSVLLMAATSSILLPLIRQGILSASMGLYVLAGALSGVAALGVAKLWRPRVAVVEAS